LPRKAKSAPGSKAPVVEATAVKQDVNPASTVQAVVVSRSTEGDRLMTQEVEVAQTAGSPILNGVKAVGEIAVVPGASLILDGNIKDAAIHVAGAYAARALLGPLGWAYFAADSYSKSVSGKSLYQYFVPSKAS
jgi:hypothetical protein